MSAYSKILVAVDLADDCLAVVERAITLNVATENISLVHVFEPIPAPYASVIPYAPGLAAAEDLDIKVKSNLQGKLEKLAADHGIAAERCYLVEGHPSREIKHFAAEHGADLIVIGTHGRHGLGLMLGSTANGVLHGTSCDVLAVKISN